MTPAALLMPHLALQFPSRVRSHDLLAFLPKRLRLLEHPRVTRGMFRRANGAVANVLREVLRMREDLCLGQLGEGGDWVDSVGKTLHDAASFSRWDTHSSVTGVGRPPIRLVRICQDKSGSPDLP